MKTRTPELYVSGRTMNKLGWFAQWCARYVARAAVRSNGLPCRCRHGWAWHAHAAGACIYDGCKCAQYHAMTWESYTAHPTTPGPTGTVAGEAEK